MAQPAMSELAARRVAFYTVPTTCDTVRAALDAAMAEIMTAYDIDPAEQAGIDSIMSRAFLSIRDYATNPLREALIKSVMQWPAGSVREGVQRLKEPPPLQLDKGCYREPPCDPQEWAEFVQQYQDPRTGA